MCILEVNYHIEIINITTMSSDDDDNEVAVYDDDSDS
jgi:hypothetical protein